MFDKFFLEMLESLLCTSKKLQKISAMVNFFPLVQAIFLHPKAAHLAEVTQVLAALTYLLSSAEHD
ncbi:MAG: hypothetical protein H6765_11290 [Candidatus Peribacteria bacterium]|nr:MAG: hypothetical protein H6765_11290 [Candidatus Peribacteria bacterium]